MNPVSTWGNGRAAAIRDEDQAPMKALLHALCEERRNALVVSEDEWVLEAIGAHLARVLRRRPDLQLELYQPSNSEALLARFNGMLADLPVHAAQAVVQPHERLRVWVLHLTRPSELPEVQLLLRLVQGFPGAGVRLLLLFSAEVAAAQSTGLLGGRLHRWEVDPPPEPRAAAPNAAAVKAVEVLDTVGTVGEGQRNGGAVWPLQGLRGRLRLARACGLGTPSRWAMGLFGLSLALSGGMAAWWHSRPAAPNSPSPGASRPVPEIRETLDSRASLRAPVMDVTESR